MKKINYLVIAISFLLVTCKTQQKENRPSTKFTSRVYQSELNEFGYDIFEDSAILIRQAVIPGIHGNKKFRSAEEAKRVAELVIQKLEKNDDTPSVSVHELDSLKIHY